MDPKLNSAIITAGTSLLGTIGDLFSGYSNAQMVYKQNRNLQQWQQEYTKQNMQTQFDYNKYFQERQYQQQQESVNAANEYNTPANQMARLQAAGINPFTAWSNGQGSSGTQSTVPSGSSGSVGLGSVGLPSAISPNFQLSQSFSSFANAFKSLAEAKKTGMDTSLLEATFDDMVKKIKSESIQSEALAVIQQIEASIKNEKEQAIIQNLLKDLDKKQSDIDLNLLKSLTEQEQMDYIKKQTDKLDEEIKEIISRTNLNVQQSALLYKFAELRQQAEIDEIRSRISLNKASASNQLTQAEDARATRSARIRNLNADARLKDSLSQLNEREFTIKDSSTAYETANYLNEQIREYANAKLLDEQSVALIQSTIAEAKRLADTGLLREAQDYLNFAKSVITTSASAEKLLK